jgi:hypothetical protein
MKDMALKATKKRNFEASFHSLSDAVSFISRIKFLTAHYEKQPYMVESIRIMSEPDRDIVQWTLSPTDGHVDPRANFGSMFSGVAAREISD